MFAESNCAKVLEQRQHSPMSLHPALSKWPLQFIQSFRRQKSEDKNLCKEMKPVNPIGNQSWISIGGTDAEAEAPILWLPDAQNWLIGKNPDAGKDWRQEEKEMTEDEMVGWHHWLNGHEFEQAPGDGEGQGNLAFHSPCGHRESDITEQLKNNNKIKHLLLLFLSQRSPVYIPPFGIPLLTDEIHLRSFLSFWYHNTTFLGYIFNQ